MLPDNWSTPVQESVTLPESDELDLDAETIDDILTDSTTQLISRKDYTPSKRVYVMSGDNLGQYIAHSIAGMAHPPPITLVFPHDSFLETWHQEGEALAVVRSGMAEFRSGFQVESLDPRRFETTPGQRLPAVGDESSNIIDHLIVTGDGLKLIPQLLRIRHRLLKTSTICFIQTALGVIEDINKQVFYDPQRRPKYMQGFGYYSIFSDPQRDFNVMEHGDGYCDVSICPPNAHSWIDAESTATTSVVSVSPPDDQWIPTTKYLMGTLAHAPGLSVTGLPHDRLMLRVLRHVASKSVIGPLTALFDCRNGSLLHNKWASRIMANVLEETCAIIEGLPEFEAGALYTADIKRLSYACLHSDIIRSLTKAGHRSSSMQLRVRKGSMSEIRYVNGYLIRRARDLGLDCRYNEMLVAMVRAKEGIAREQQSMMLPMA